ncbi:MAG: hypothetical protein DRI75_12755 [Bacteroidetes bacterium]|nr:MAG: hypothetical protein DRI75_12755 [Bacteroidota bacterium]
MKQQSFNNHSKWVIGYHLVTFLAILALIVGSIINLVNSSDDNLYASSLLVLISFILLFLFYFLRAFALRAQDRAIKTEENFRHYLLTGKPLSNKITVRQIIGLRFSSDEEFPALAEKAEKENLSEKEIKKEIKNWKTDSYRV